MRSEMTTSEFGQWKRACIQELLSQLSDLELGYSSWNFGQDEVLDGMTLILRMKDARIEGHFPAVKLRQGPDCLKDVIWRMIVELRQ